MADHPLDRMPEPTKSRRLFKQRSLVPAPPASVTTLVRTTMTPDGEQVVIRVRLPKPLVDRCMSRANKEGATLNQILVRTLTTALKSRTT